MTKRRPLANFDIGGIVVRIFHHARIFVSIRLFGEKAAWVHQEHDNEQPYLFYMMIGLTHHKKRTSCTLPSLIRDPGRLFIFENLPSRVGVI